MEYQLLWGIDNEQLSLDVAQLLGEGYDLYGSPTANQHGVYQAVIKK